MITEHFRRIRLKMFRDHGNELGARPRLPALSYCARPARPGEAPAREAIK